MSPAVLLVVNKQGDTVAVGPFVSMEKARDFEDRMPQLEVVGCCRLLKQSSTEIGLDR